MSKAELLEEFARLSPRERTELWDALWTMEESGRLESEAPGSVEKAILDREWEAYQQNPEAGRSWADVDKELRRKQ